MLGVIEVLADGECLIQRRVGSFCPLEAILKVDHLSTIFLAHGFPSIIVLLICLFLRDGDMRRLI